MFHVYIYTYLYLFFITGRYKITPGCISARPLWYVRWCYHWLAHLLLAAASVSKPPPFSAITVWDMLIWLPHSLLHCLTFSSFYLHANYVYLLLVFDFFSGVDGESLADFCAEVGGCLNGGTCYNRCDTFWCDCHGYSAGAGTGKRCERL